MVTTWMSRAGHEVVVVVLVVVVGGGGGRGKGVIRDGGSGLMQSSGAV